MISGSCGSKEDEMPISSVKQELPSIYITIPLVGRLFVAVTVVKESSKQRHLGCNSKIRTSLGSNCCAASCCKHRRCCIHRRQWRVYVADEKEARRRI